MWSVFPTLKYALSYTLYASVKIGQFIVTTVETLLTNCFAFFSKLLILLTVIIEDFTIFIRDVRHNLVNIVTSLFYLCERIAAYVTGAWYNTLDLLQTLYNLVTGIHIFGRRTLFAFLNGLKNIFICLKQIILMFGDGVWFIVVYIPKSIIILCLDTINYAKNLCFETLLNICAYMKHLFYKCFESIHDCYQFLTDVPMESFIGLLIAVCFLYIFLQFYSIMYNYLQNKISSLFYGLKRKYNGLKRTAIRLLSRTKQEVSRPSFQYKSPSTKTTDDHGFCIICQDHPKCILVLPCKHLCLCMDCTPRLMRYTGRCPICRKHITSTMKIFT